MDEMLHAKVDKLNEQLSTMNATLAVQAVQLAEHMRRTEQNEKLIEAVSVTLKPMIKHVNQIEGVLKFLGVLSLLVGIAAGIVKVLG